MPTGTDCTSKVDKGVPGSAQQAGGVEDQERQVRAAKVIVLGKTFASTIASNTLSASFTCGNARASIARTEKRAARGKGGGECDGTMQQATPAHLASGARAAN